MDNLFIHILCDSCDSEDVNYLGKSEFFSFLLSVLLYKSHKDHLRAKGNENCK